MLARGEVHRVEMSGDIFRRSLVLIRIALVADIVIIVIIIRLRTVHLLALIPRPSRETKDMEGHGDTVVDIISSKREGVIPHRALVRHGVIILRSITVRGAGAEENELSATCPCSRRRAIGF